MAPRIGVEPNEGRAWIGAFEFLQSLRLQVQLAAGSGEDGGEGQPARKDANSVDVHELNDIDRQMLKESMRVARRLQQRMELDYQR